MTCLGQAFSFSHPNCEFLVDLGILNCQADIDVIFACIRYFAAFEPPRGKTNNVVSKQVLHKPACTVTEAGYKLEISDLSRRGIVLSE